MSSGGLNDFFEEKCVPVKRPTRPPTELPNQLKPKFPTSKTPDMVNSPAMGTPTSQPVGNTSPTFNQVGTPAPAPPAPVQAPATAPPPAPAPAPTNQDNQAVAAPPVAPVAQTTQNSQEKEHPSADGIGLDKTKSADNPGEMADAPKKKKKPKKKKEEPTNPGVIFLDDSDKKVKDPNNAVGQFVEEEDEEEKKKKKKEGKDKETPKKLPKAPTPRAAKKDNEPPKTDASVRGKRNKSERATRKEQTSSRQTEVKKKEERSQRIKKNPAVVNNFQKKDKESGSQRVVKAKPSVNKVSNPVKPAPPPTQPAAPGVSPAAPTPKESKDAPTLKGDKNAKEPNEGFFKAMYYKTRQKISTMAKNPNTPPSSSGCDDTLVATDATAIKTDVSAVYGLPVDYPKGIVPPRTDKNHPDRLFPVGRPFWMNRDEKPPQAKVIMMGVVDQCIKDNTLKLLQQQTRPETFDPFCEDVQDLHERDEEFFLDYRRILANTVYNSCSMKAYAFGTLRLKKNSTRETPSSLRRARFVPPTQCTVYTRKEHKKKPTVVKYAFVPGTRPRLVEAKKKKKSGATASGRE